MTVGGWVVSITVLVDEDDVVDGPLRAVAAALAHLHEPTADHSFDVDHIIGGQRQARYFVRRRAGIIEAMR